MCLIYPSTLSQDTGTMAFVSLPLIWLVYQNINGHIPKVRCLAAAPWFSLIFSLPASIVTWVAWKHGALSPEAWWRTGALDLNYTTGYDEVLPKLSAMYQSDLSWMNDWQVPCVQNYKKYDTTISTYYYLWKTISFTGIMDVERLNDVARTTFLAKLLSSFL